MATLEENRSLMQRIFNLPANDAELRQIGFGDDEINAYKDLLSLLDPEANRQVQRMRDIIAYCDKLDSPKKQV